MLPNVSYWGRQWKVGWFFFLPLTGKCKIWVEFGLVFQHAKCRKYAIKHLKTCLPSFCCFRLFSVERGTMSCSLWIAGFVIDLQWRSYCFLLYGEFALITEMSGLDEVPLVNRVFSVVIFIFFLLACMS